MRKEGGKEGMREGSPSLFPSFPPTTLEPRLQLELPVELPVVDFVHTEVLRLQRGRRNRERQCQEPGSAEAGKTESPLSGIR